MINQTDINSISTTRCSQHSATNNEVAKIVSMRRIVYITNILSVVMINQPASSSISPPHSTSSASLRRFVEIKQKANVDEEKLDKSGHVDESEAAVGHAVASCRFGVETLDVVRQAETGDHRAPAKARKSPQHVGGESVDGRAVSYGQEMDEDDE